VRIFTNKLEQAMTMIFATLITLLTAAALIILGTAFMMIARRNPALAAQIHEAQGSLDNIRRGQMKAPERLPGHLVCGGLAWNSATNTHERQSAVSIEALKSVYLSR
jgi:hypothetical protein